MTRFFVRVFGISLTGLDSSLLYPQKLTDLVSVSDCLNCVDQRERWLAQACESEKCVSVSP